MKVQKNKQIGQIKIRLKQLDKCLPEIEQLFNISIKVKITCSLYVQITISFSFLLNKKHFVKQQKTSHASQYFQDSFGFPNNWRIKNKTAMRSKKIKMINCYNGKGRG